MNVQDIIVDVLCFTALAVLLGAIAFLVPLRNAAKCRAATKKRRVPASSKTASPPRINRKLNVGVVLVGGDFARSPRMQYHATSMASCGLYSRVRCVGLDEGNRVAETLENLPDISFLLVRGGEVPWLARKLGWLGRTVYRVLYFIVSFAVAMWNATAPVPDALPRELTTVTIVAQTPPAVPFLLLLHAIVSVRWWHDWYLRHLPEARRGSEVKIVIDFHNFGYTLLEIDRRPRFVVLAYRWLEVLFGAGDAHFTVSFAMRRRLSGSDGVVKPWLALSDASVTVLHDAAPDFFAPLAVEQRRTAIDAISTTETELKFPAWVPDHRPGDGNLVLVSSTSWTADDDYTLVVEALKKIDAKIAALPSTVPKPRVWLLATGKGATRAVFERQVREANFSAQIQVTTHYFQSFKSYAKMLAVADAGLCVHRSSSGLDLPMKCVDMFGAGIPVMALDYPALDELVTPRKGWIFTNEVELEAIIYDLVDPANVRAGVHRLKQRSMEVVATRATWDTTWRSGALPVLTELVARSESS